MNKKELLKELLPIVCTIAIYTAFGAMFGLGWDFLQQRAHPENVGDIVTRGTISNVIFGAVFGLFGGFVRAFK